MTAAPDNIDYKKFRFSDYVSSAPEGESASELFIRVWEDLRERRRQRACARCGWFVTCSIQEVSKYRKYKIRYFMELKPNTLDKNTSGDICIPCGTELVGGLLGTSSQRTRNLSNRPQVERKGKGIACLCNTRFKMNLQLVKLCHRIDRIKKTTIEIENPQQLIEDIVKKIEQRKKWVELIEKKVDSLVSIYNLK